MYHYTESGLPNVWLENGYVVQKTPYGRAVAIEHADSLHKVLAIEITKKKGRITGKELRFLRLVLELSQENLAHKCFGLSEQAVSLYERTGKVPAQADTIIRMLVLEKLNGNVRITDILHRINDVDRLVNQRIVASETRNRWASRVQEEVEAPAFA